MITFAFAMTCLRLSSRVASLVSLLPLSLAVCVAASATTPDPAESLRTDLASRLVVEDSPSGPCVLHLPPPDAPVVPAVSPLERSGEGQPYRIVLRLLVLRRSDGTGGMTDLTLLDDMMRDLNHGFRDTPFVFVALPTIEYVDSDVHFTLETLQDAIDLMNAYATPGVVNVFFSEQRLFGATQARAFTSVAFPRGHIFADVVGQPYDPPFPPHEIGHLFYLFHPYETQFGTECVSGSNCAIAGDKVCDTPASPAVFNGNTTATGIYYGGQAGPCPGDPPYAPRTDLYMEAGWAPGHAGYMYRSAFSQGQIDRMVSTLLTLSSDLIGPARPEVLVDCDGDLVDDIDEIAGGTEVDLNEDKVPDACQVFVQAGDLIVSGMHPGLTNRPRFFDGTTGEWRGDLWSGAWWQHQYRMGPDGLLYATSLTVIQRLDLATGRLVDNFVDGVLEGASTFVDLLFDGNDDLLLLDNVSNNIRRYSGVDGSYMGVFTSLSPVGMTSPKYMEYGPGGDIFIVGNGAQGNTIQRVDGATGALHGSFIATGAGGLTAGQGLTFHTDGRLYVSNGGANDVLRFDALTGAFIDVFVQPGSGGLVNPHSLRFGPDGRLYVASRGTQSVKRYDASGGYLGDFVAPGAGGSPGSGGVTEPTGLLFAPNVNPVAVGTQTSPSPGLALRAVRPNPFAHMTTIQLELPQRAVVTLSVYDVRGARVRTLARGVELEAGRHAISWDGTLTDGRRAAPGVYVCALESGGVTAASRVVMVR